MTSLKLRVEWRLSEARDSKGREMGDTDQRALHFSKAEERRSGR